MDLGFSLERISRKTGRKERGQERREAGQESAGVEEKGGGARTKRAAETGHERKMSKIERLKMLDMIMVREKDELEAVPEEEKKELVKLVVKLLNQVRSEPEKKQFPEDARPTREYIRDRTDRKRKIVTISGSSVAKRKRI